MAPPLQQLEAPQQGSLYVRMDGARNAEPAAGPAMPTPERALAHATIDQVNRVFVPRVTVIRTNTEVTFPNSDNIRHSIYSFSPPTTFTTKLYSGRQAPPVVFDRPGLVVLG
jgi:plastocyanin